LILNHEFKTQDKDYLLCRSAVKEILWGKFLVLCERLQGQIENLHKAVQPRILTALIQFTWKNEPNMVTHTADPATARLESTMQTDWLHEGNDDFQRKGTHTSKQRSRHSLPLFGFILYLAYIFHFRRKGRFTLLQWHSCKAAPAPRQACAARRTLLSAGAHSIR
jgi:hypothetical protein